MVGDTLWDATVGRLLDGLADALVDMFTLAMTWWLRPDLDPVAIGAGAVAGVGPIARTVGAIVLAVGLMGAGVRLAWRRDGSDLVEVVGAVARFVLVTTAGAAVVTVLLRLSNALTAWIMPTAANTDITDPTTSWFIVALPAAVTAVVASMPIVAVLLAVLFVGSTLAMFVTVLFRTASIIVLMVALPIAAAGGTTITTRQWFPKVLGWLLALIFWRPVAAMVYRIAAELPQAGTDTTAGSLQVILMALTMMLLAVAALPAMMRLFSFATGSLGPGGGGLGVAVAAGSVAGEMVRVRGEAAVAQASMQAASAGPGADTATGAAPTGPAGGATTTTPTGGPAAPAGAAASGSATATAGAAPAATGEPTSTAVLAGARTVGAVVTGAQQTVTAAADDATPQPDGSHDQDGPRP
jgi:hypothetical protein